MTTTPLELCIHLLREAPWATEGELLLCCTCRLMATMAKDGVVTEVMPLAA